jgi:hypothetical protein
VTGAGPPGGIASQPRRRLFDSVRELCEQLGETVLA